MLEDETHGDQSGGPSCPDKAADRGGSLAQISRTLQLTHNLVMIKWDLLQGCKDGNNFAIFFKGQSK